MVNDEKDCLSFVKQTVFFHFPIQGGRVDMQHFRRFPAMSSARLQCLEYGLSLLRFSLREQVDIPTFWGHAYIQFRSLYYWLSCYQYRPLTLFCNSRTFPGHR